MRIHHALMASLIALFASLPDLAAAQPRTQGERPATAGRANHRTIPPRGRTQERRQATHRRGAVTRQGAALPTADTLTVEPVSGSDRFHVSGSIAPPNGTKGGLYLVATRTYDARPWLIARLLAPDRVSANANSARWDWIGRNRDLPGPDLGKGYDISAVILPEPHGPWPLGAIDRETLNRYPSPAARPARYPIPASHDESRAEEVCAISISSVYDIENKWVSVRGKDPAPPTPIANIQTPSPEPASPDNKSVGYGAQQPRTGGGSEPLQTIDVPLNVPIKGVVDKPESYAARLVVQPIETDNKWVQAPRGTINDREWTETAWFGREVLDAGGLFRVQAFVFPENVDPIEGGYTPAQWWAIEKTACARSQEVLVRRRTAATDLVIVQIGDVDVPEDRKVQAEASKFRVSIRVEGNQRDYGLASDQHVEIWSMPAVGVDDWKVSAVAFSGRDRFTFVVPALRLQEAGEYLLLAVASKGKLLRGTAINDDKLYKMATDATVERISRTVLVTVPEPRGQSISPMRTQGGKQ